MQGRVRSATPEKKSLQFRTRLEYELLAQALFLLQQTINTGIYARPDTDD